MGSPSSSSASDAERSGYARVATVSPEALVPHRVLDEQERRWLRPSPETGKKACGSPAMETGGDVPGGGVAGPRAPTRRGAMRSPARRPVAGVPATSGVSPAISSRVSGPRRYDMAQRECTSTGFVRCTSCMRNTRLRVASSRRSISARGDARCRRGRPAAARGPARSGGAPRATAPCSRGPCSRGRPGSGWRARCRRPARAPASAASAAGAWSAGSRGAGGK